MAELATLSRTQDAGLDRVGVALSDSVRRSILLELLNGPAFPSDMAESLGTSRSNLSNHLACLRGCGLVVVERFGRQLQYRLVDDDFAAALSTLVAVSERLPVCDEHLRP